MKWFIVIHVVQAFYASPPANIPACPWNTVCDGTYGSNLYTYENDEKLEAPSLEICQQVAKLNRNATCWAQAETPK